ncbi:MAG: hypothetical protein R2827_16020 [Bdellovibrionales bacterium]
MKSVNLTFNFFLSFTLLLQAPVAFSAPRNGGSMGGYNKNFHVLDRIQQRQPRNGAESYQRQQQNIQRENERWANNQNRNGQVTQSQRNQGLVNARQRGSLLSQQSSKWMVDGKLLNNQHPIWYEGDARPDFPKEGKLSHRYNTVQYPSSHPNTAYRDFIGPDGEVYRRHVTVTPERTETVVNESGRSRRVLQQRTAQFRDVILPDGTKPSDLRSQLKSYREMRAPILPKFALDTLGFYFAGNAVQGSLHSLGGLKINEKFNGAVTEMIANLKCF